MNLHAATISMVSFTPRAINEGTKRVNSDAPNKLSTKFLSHDSLDLTTKPCFCGRRHFMEAATLGTTLFPIQPSKATKSSSDYTDSLNKFHPPKPDWYEEFYAWILNSATKAYEAEVAQYKSQVFSNLKGNAHKILEIGIGTGPNLSYYAGDSDVQVVGIDPNPKMEKYAQSSAASAGLPLSNFEFIQAVGEVIPLSDASVDAVVGTLVLCSVKDVDMTLKEVKNLYDYSHVMNLVTTRCAASTALAITYSRNGLHFEVRRVLRPGGLYVFVEHVAAKDGTFLKFVQRVLDPLQQTLSDGCHLSRETGNNISRAGFSSVELDMAFLSNASFVNPHAYGIAYK